MKITMTKQADMKSKEKGSYRLANKEMTRTNEQKDEGEMHTTSLNFAHIFKYIRQT